MASDSKILVTVTDVVEIDRLQPNPWNTNVVSPENEAKLDESMRRFGCYKPIIVRTLESGALEIIGGEHRWGSARRLGLETVPIVNLGKINDTKAKEIGLADNGRYGEDDTLKLADLLKELGHENVTEFLPYTDADLASILSASSIALDDLDMPSDTGLPGELASPAPQTHQIMRFKVPIEDSDWVTKLLESTMREQGFTKDDSMGNAGNALIHLIKGARK